MAAKELNAFVEKVRAQAFLELHFEMKTKRRKAYSVQDEEVKGKERGKIEENRTKRRK